MKVKLYGIARVRDGKREWYRGSWGWGGGICADEDTMADAQEVVDEHQSWDKIYLYADETSEWEGAQVVEFVAEV